jgi:hypothetical protein
MKIICIEEHTVDAAAASCEAQTAEAGYMADWGSRVTDDPTNFNDNRPHLVSPQVSFSAGAGTTRRAFR